MFKMVAILGLVAGGAGYALYEHTDLFGSKGVCGSGECQVAVKKLCCESDASAVPACCATPCAACAGGCDGCPLCEDDCSACCGPTTAVAAKPDCCAANKPCCDTVEACCPTATVATKVKNPPCCLKTEVCPECTPACCALMGGAGAAVAGPAAFVAAK
jgi:hypothetical protein